MGVDYEYSEKFGTGVWFLTFFEWRSGRVKRIEGRIV